MRDGPKRAAAVAAWACILGLCGGVARADNFAEDPTATYDCGTLALYMLSGIEHKPADLTVVAKWLPRPSSRGYSLRDLRDAARNWGLHLTGVRLRRGQTLDRPALAFVRRGDHGHFLVVRPVGQSGKLLQLVDAVDDPEVVDAEVLYRSRQWTGLILLPSRPDWGVRAVCVALLIALCLGLRLARRQLWCRVATLCLRSRRSPPLAGGATAAAEGRAPTDESASPLHGARLRHCAWGTWN